MSITALHQRGVFSAALTPVTEALAPDHALFVAHCRQLLEEGCDGIALLCTTGEANSLSSDERRALLESVVSAGIAPDRLLPGNGRRRADREGGADAAGAAARRDHVMLPPFYYKGITDVGLFASYAEVIERVADPRLRVVLAVSIPVPVIARLRAAHPGVFRCCTRAVRAASPRRRTLSRPTSPSCSAIRQCGARGGDRGSASPHRRSAQPRLALCADGLKRCSSPIAPASLAGGACAPLLPLSAVEEKALLED